MLYLKSISIGRSEAALDSVKKKLLTSLPYKTFRAERDVSDLLEHSGWKATHGLYYEDTDTKKQRELDVVARQIWQRSQHDVTQLCRITLIIEVKSMIGFHLLLSKHPATNQNFYEHIRWLGDGSGKYLEIAEMLRALDVEESKISALVRKLHRYAYPRETARMRPMMIRPNAAPVFTSFRETNMGSEKELEVSVFWRASQGLRSAFKAICQDIHETHLINLRDAAEFEANSTSWPESMLWWTRERVSILDIVHPIVVTDAQLWLSDSSGPTECSFARFGAHTYTGSMSWWCDVVNASHLPRYIAELSKHYRSKLRRIKAKLGSY
ncbi:MAG: hypothetical protein OJF61_000615 [Rhodanobacteraceae bacterium]|jgi:hypothetical protein|nr:MAG: hypothetical protein OJF61_000615 [Rhodanobacteraceae bacterium]